MIVARGKRLSILAHAYEGMDAERPPIRPQHVAEVLEDPDSDDGAKARAWRRRRTILVYYEEKEQEIEVRGVSATRRRLDP